MLDCIKVSVCRWLVMVAAVLLGAFAHAEVVPGLYHATVLVPAQDVKSRNAAITTGLEQVLIKVSGSASVRDLPVINTALGQSQQYLDAYRYASTSEQITTEQGVHAATRLELTYNRVAIDRLLHQAGLPLWPDNRPAVLLWVVADVPELGRTLVTPADQPAFYDAVTAAAAARGLPVIRPLLDLEDRLAVSVDQLWDQQDSQLIMDASARYQADAVAVVRLSTLPSGEPVSSWLLLHKDQPQLFEGSGVDLPGVVASGLGQVATYLASLYAISAQQEASTDLSVQVRNIQTFADYTTLQTYLGRLGVIKRVELVSILDTEVSLRIVANAAPAQVLDALRLDRKLMPVETVDGATGDVPTAQVGSEAPVSPLGSVSAGTAQPLIYRWVR